MAFRHYPASSFAFLTTLLAVVSLCTSVEAQSRNNNTKRPTSNTSRPSQPSPSSNQSRGEPTPAIRPTPETTEPKPSAESVQAKPNQTSATRLASREASPPSTTPAPTALKSSDRDDGKFLLRYSLKSGETITSEVTHLVKTNTKISDVSESSQSRTFSVKTWKVIDIDQSGNITFSHQIESVDMYQQVGDGEELRYDSEKDDEPNAVFQNVADSIGKPLDTITISPTGKVINREGEGAKSNLGMGDIAIPLPDAPIAIGDSWETPREVRVRRTDGTPKTIKVRELYTLEKVKTGVAVISIRSEPLTPMTEPEVESQALQQMSNGEIRFDLDEGRLISKELIWEKSVVGFSGPGSVMNYSARFTEEVK